MTQTHMDAVHGYSYHTWTHPLIKATAKVFDGQRSAPSLGLIISPRLAAVWVETLWGSRAAE